LGSAGVAVSLKPGQAILKVGVHSLTQKMGATKLDAGIIRIVRRGLSLQTTLLGSDNSEIQGMIIFDENLLFPVTMYESSTDEDQYERKQLQIELLGQLVGNSVPNSRPFATVQVNLAEHIRPGLLKSLLVACTLTETLTGIDTARRPVIWALELTFELLMTEEAVQAEMADAQSQVSSSPQGHNVGIMALKAELKKRMLDELKVRVEIWRMGYIIEQAARMDSRFG